MVRALRWRKYVRVFETVSAMACIVIGILILRWVVWEDEGPLALAWAGIWLIGIPPMIVAQRLKRAAERPDPS